MKFKMTYEQTSYKTIVNPRYYIDGKRVTETTFDTKEVICRIRNMQYNASSLKFNKKTKRYESVFYYD